jgi:hypothetical protein
MVSSHFGYTEEYVMDHSPWWLIRKYKQASREKWEESRQRTIESFRSLMLLSDGLLNKGKGASEILPPPYEEAVKAAAEKEKKTKQYITGQWWKQTG